MSTEFGYIDTIDGKLYLTRLWGGADHGVSVQLTCGSRYITLSKIDAYNLINALSVVFKNETVVEGE
jgi:hypothetical protein